MDINPSSGIPGIPERFRIIISSLMISNYNFVVTKSLVYFNDFYDTMEISFLLKCIDFMIRHMSIVLGKLRLE